MTDDELGLDLGGTGTMAYADAVAVYLGRLVSKLSDAQSSFVSWRQRWINKSPRSVGKPIPMVWDYSEA